MYLPLELLNNYTEKCCISWQELDLARTVYRKQHELPDELYITKNGSPVCRSGKRKHSYGKRK